MHWFRKFLLFLPFGCLATFAVLYFLAVAYYPGGHRHDPGFEGHSAVYNYYSDLFHHTAYNGEVNHGRPFALASLALLVLTFLTFWFNVTNHWFPKGLKVAGNVFGLALVGSFSLITVFHDLVLTLGMVLGCACLACLVPVLYRRRERRLLQLTLVFFILVSTNFVLWATQFLEPMLPMLQKTVLIAFGVWIVVLNAKVLKYKSGKAVS